MSPRWLWEIWWPSKVISHYQRGETGTGGEGWKERQGGVAIEWVVLPPPYVVLPAKRNSSSSGRWKVEHLNDTHTLTHKQQVSPPDVCLRCPWQVCVEEVRDSSQIKSTPFTSPSTASAERHLLTHFLLRKKLKLSIRFKHVYYLTFNNNKGFLFWGLNTNLWVLPFLELKYNLLKTVFIFLNVFFPRCIGFFSIIIVKSKNKANRSNPHGSN